MRRDLLASSALLLCSPTSAYGLGGAAPRVVGSHRRVPQAATMQFINENSLAAKMFGTVADGLKGLADAAGLNKDDEAEAAAATAASPEDAANDVAADLDARAQTGDLTFRDFMTMSEAFMKMGPGKNVPGMPEMSASQLLETREKFEKHEKIVDVMLPEELDSPELLIEDLKAGGSTPGPRIQRLAKASGQPETEVGLFIMQFEATRESTRRIAAGEDPDEVTESMGAGPGSNRAARRAAKRGKKKSKSKSK